MKKKKYFYMCSGGYVISKNDNNKHYVDSDKLPRLYKIPKDNCIFIKKNTDNNKDQLYGIYKDFLGEIILLYPDMSGKYKIKFTKYLKVYMIRMYRNFKLAISKNMFNISISLLKKNDMYMSKYRTFLDNKIN